MTESELQAWRDMSEDELESTDILPYCSKNYTLEKSKAECPLGGCWKYRCYNSKLNPSWSKARKEWKQKRFQK